MTKKVWELSALTASVLLAACADPTSPTRSLTGEVSAIVNPFVPANPFPNSLDWGEVRVCKTVPAGDPVQTFSFTATVTPVQPAGPALPPINFSIDAVPGQTVCTDIFDSQKNGVGYDRVVIVENTLPADWANTDIDVVRYRAINYTPPAGFAETEDETTRTASIVVNSDEGRVVTFTNDYTAPPPPPPAVCGYTKGWYRNKGSSTVIAIDGRSIAEAQAIFKATPGKPNGVTWGSDNNNLTLYQQLLAALQNLKGDPLGGPAAVDQAIADALAGTDGTGLVIIVAPGTDVSGLINTLSSFNEGKFAGFPHCSDEIIDII